MDGGMAGRMMRPSTFENTVSRCWMSACPSIGVVCLQPDRGALLAVQKRPGYEGKARSISW